jgi:hypothetical protein
MRVVSKKLRDSAKNQDCAVRIPGACNFNPETTVLAHIPCGHKGVGIKGPDMIAVFACSGCHDAIDGRSRVEVDASDLLRALAETQIRWIELGLMTIKGVA